MKGKGEFLVSSIGVTVDLLRGIFDKGKLGGGGGRGLVDFENSTVEELGNWEDSGNMKLGKTIGSNL